jgi:uncharacterized protein YaaR (DUF327 family)
MDKVDSLDAPFFSRRSEEKKTRKKSPAGRREFSTRLQEAQREGELSEDLADGRRRGRQSLEKLLDEVHESGDELLAAQTLQNIKRYRNSVKSFLEQVLQRMVSLEQKASELNVLKRKRFTQIRVVDGKLERLVAELLASQHRQLDILGRLNEINGLLVDLMS